MTLPTLIPEFAFTVGAADSDYLYLDDLERGLLDSGRLAPDSLWQNVAADGMAVTVSQGVQRYDGPTIRAEAGRMVLRLKDADRDYDPTNLAGPYVTAGVTQVVPMRGARLRATWAGVTYDLFRGFADSWDISYSGEPRVAFVTVPCTDGIKVLANFDGVAGGSVGAGESSGARVARILDNVGWPASDRQIATGDTSVQATTLAANAWTELLLTSDTELGEIYVDGAGKLVFRNRTATLTESRSTTSQATFGDGGGSELPYHDLTPVYDDTQIRNLVRATRVGGAQQVAQDATSQDAYLVHTFDRDDLLMQTDAEALSWAQIVLWQNKDPEYRFETIEIRPLTAPASLFPEVLGRKLGDRITVRRRPPGGGDPIEQDAFIRGIQHEVTPGSWITRWALQSAAKQAFFVLNNVSLGRLDRNALAF